MTSAQQILVLGLGGSGQAAAKLALQRGSSVLLYDDRSFSGIEGLDELIAQGAVWCVEPLAAGPDLCVVSPGVPPGHAVLCALRVAGVPIVSELAFGAAHLNCRIMAVTGSLGKSTVVTAMETIMRKSGLDVQAGGNLGLAASAIAMNPPTDWAVLEVSSFQMEWPGDMAPDVALLLNLFPNHLDRHGTLNCYLELKLRLLYDADVAVVPAGLRERLTVHPRLIPFAAATLADIRLAGTVFASSVLTENAAGMVAALRAAGVQDEQIAAGLQDCHALPHRMAQLGELDGVLYVNDSKATCLQAVAGAVAGLAERPIRLLVGGRLKEADLSGILPVLQNHVTAVYSFGEAASEFAAAWRGVLNVQTFEHLEQALEAARQDAVCGDCILLSPGGTSFDYFTGYAARGRAMEAWFREAGTC